MGEVSFRFAFVPAAKPYRLLDRPFDDLLQNGWQEPAQALHVTTRLQHEPDLRAATRAVLASDAPELAKQLALVTAMEAAQRRGERDAMVESAAALVARHGAEVERAGGLVPWLEGAWPLGRKELREAVGTVAIACAAAVAYARVAVASQKPIHLPVEESSDMAVAIAALAALRDALLDRAAIPRGTPGERVARAAAVVLHATPSPLGERRRERWEQAIRGREATQIADLTLRDYGAYYAALLHSLVVSLRTRLDASEGLATHDFARWRPEETPAAGLLERPLELVARALVLRAGVEPEGDEALRRLARARELCDWNDTFARIHAEARFRAGAWDAALLVDLEREGRGFDALAPSAEMLRVAEQLGDRSAARLARRRLRAAVAGAGAGPSSAHDWIVEARIVLARPNERADLAKVGALLSRDAPAAPDMSERAAFALYGPDAAQTVDTLRARLRDQKEALEWAALLEVVRVEEREASPEGLELPRPDVPRAPGPGVLALALAALRFRVARPALQGHPLRRALRAHLSRAEATALGDDDPSMTPWLLALGGDRGLVPALDARLGGGADAIEAALVAADAALEDAVRERWLQQLYERLRSLRALVADRPERASALRALEDRAAAAMDETTRATLERATTDLLAAIQDEDAAGAPAGTPGSDEHDDDDAPEEERFRPLRFEQGAMERSREELATPEWALQEGVRQLALYNLARGRRDIKMLRGTRDAEGALWELRHRDARHPVRVLYVLHETGPRAVAVLAKQDDAHQARMIERVRGWMR